MTAVVESFVDKGGTANNYFKVAFRPKYIKAEDEDSDFDEDELDYRPHVESRIFMFDDTSPASQARALQAAKQFRLRLGHVYKQMSVLRGSKALTAERIKAIKLGPGPLDRGHLTVAE